jgi:hypothetical protein
MLSTILSEIDAAINSRPLLQDESAVSLIPAYFLHGGKLTVIPAGPEPATTNDLRKQFRLSQ